MLLHVRRQESKNERKLHPSCHQSIELAEPREATRLQVTAHPASRTSGAPTTPSSDTASPAMRRAASSLLFIYIRISVSVSVSGSDPVSRKVCSIGAKVCSVPPIEHGNGSRGRRSWCGMGGLHVPACLLFVRSFQKQAKASGMAMTRFADSSIELPIMRSTADDSRNRKTQTKAAKAPKAKAPKAEIVQREKSKEN